MPLSFELYGDADDDSKSGMLFMWADNWILTREWERKRAAACLGANCASSENKKKKRNELSRGARNFPFCRLIVYFKGSVLRLEEWVSESVLVWAASFWHRIPFPAYTISFHIVRMWSLLIFSASSLSTLFFLSFFLESAIGSKRKERNRRDEPSRDAVCPAKEVMMYVL